jgi:rod shape-determining protein MreC
MRLSRKFKKSIYKIISFLTVIIIIIALVSLYNESIKNFFYKISEPTQKFLWQIGRNISNFFQDSSEVNVLRSELDSLKLENQELLAQIALLKELEKENKALREALGLDLQKEFNLSLAQVTGRDISEDFILINKGTEDGLSEGLPVISQQKILLGRIYNVYRNYSDVRLISHRESSLEGEVSEKEILGLVKGKGNFGIIFDLVPVDQEMVEGDLVQTSALGGDFPRGILIGKIKNIKKSDIQPFYEAEIFPLFELSGLKDVFIIIDF